MAHVPYEQSGGLADHIMAPPRPTTQLRVIESCHVAPPRGSVPEASLPLTFMDAFWLYGQPPVERVFFYQFPRLLTSDFVGTVLPDLKSSLSLTLRHFYPLTGKIIRRAEPDNGDGLRRHDILYADGDSVAFNVVECVDEDFDELSGSGPREVTRLRPFVPSLPRSADAQRLLTIQVTVFPGRGVAIGVTLHHAACDGSSSAHFLSSWASCCRSGGSAAPAVAPLYDRTLIRDHYNLYSLFDKASFSTPAESSTEDAQEASGNNVVIATFTFAGDQIKRLKELVSAKSATGGAGGSFHCSSITVAFAYVWICLIKARGYEAERDCVLCFATNGRSRLSPPAPPEYFGNCMGYCLVEAKACDLVGREGFVVAAKAVGKSIEEYKTRPLVGPLDDMLVEKMSRQPLSTAGSPQFKVYDFDFGWGRPRKVEVASIARTGAMSVAESSEGGGGVEIGFVLPEHEMDEFTAHFNNGFDYLFQ